MAQAIKSQARHVVLNLGRLGISGRRALAALITKLAPDSAVFAAHANVQEATGNVVKSGGDLDAATKLLRLVEEQLTAAKTAQLTAQQKLDEDLFRYKANAEGWCKTEADFQSLGLHLRQPKGAPIALVPPATVTAKPAAAKGSLRIHATRLPGLANYLAEFSADPVGEGTWQRLPGTGAVRTLTGLVSGQRYWVRFCTARGAEQSGWSELASAAAR